MTLATRLATGSLACLLLASTVSAQDVVFVVRHAERADAGMQKGMDDPPLSASGAARAAALARMLRSAHIERVFATEFRRTQQTAEPLAKAEHVDVTIVTAKDVDALVQKLTAGKGATLVVGHSDTVPRILKTLGVKDNVKISDDEYDNLFVVIRSAGEATLVRLRF
jgi:phosphohistidine phosphatase SixA